MYHSAETIMKRRTMNARAASLCDYLCSRCNDIAGYWGIGVLCDAANRENQATFAFRILPGEPIVIHGLKVTDSNRITDKLIQLQLDSIEGRFEFILDGAYPNGVEKYNCCVTVTIAQGSRTGTSTRHVACWPHDPVREMRGGAYSGGDRQT